MSSWFCGKPVPIPASGHPVWPRALHSSDTPVSTGQGQDAQACWGLVGLRKPAAGGGLGAGEKEYIQPCWTLLPVGCRELHCVKQGEGRTLPAGPRGLSPAQLGAPTNSAPSSEAGNATGGCGVWLGCARADQHPLPTLTPVAPTASLGVSLPHCFRFSSC